MVEILILKIKYSGMRLFLRFKNRACPFILLAAKKPWDMITGPGVLLRNLQTLNTCL